MFQRPHHQGGFVIGDRGHDFILAGAAGGKVQASKK
jgi:hypothetical protein